MRGMRRARTAGGEVVSAYAKVLDLRNDDLGTHHAQPTNTRWNPFPLFRSAPRAHELRYGNVERNDQVK
jgi:hypothetical protein